MNKIILVGRLTRPPELRYTAQGSPVASFTLAVNRRFKSKDGQQDSDFIPIVVWGKQGENVAKYCSKGSQVAVYGRIQVRNYEAAEGTKRYATEVIAEEVTFLGTRKKDSPTTTDNQFDGFEPMEDDDLPF